MKSKQTKIKTIMHKMYQTKKRRINKWDISQHRKKRRILHFNSIQKYVLFDCKTTQNDEE